MTMITNVIDLEAATERGIPVTNIDHVIQTTTCDLTMALILGLATRSSKPIASPAAACSDRSSSMSFLWHRFPGR